MNERAWQEVMVYAAVGGGAQGWGRVTSLLNALNVVREMSHPMPLDLTRSFSRVMLVEHLTMVGAKCPKDGADLLVSAARIYLAGGPP